MIRIEEHTRDRLRSIIEDTGLNYKEFASSIGVNPSVITEVLSGRTTHLSKAFRTVIQLKYGINAKWLTTGEGKQYVQPTLVACPKEYELVCNYRKLSPELKTALTVIANAIYLQQKSVENVQT